MNTPSYALFFNVYLYHKLHKQLLEVNPYNNSYNNNDFNIILYVCAIDDKTILLYYTSDNSSMSSSI